MSSNSPPTESPKRGSLTIAGSGIASIVHMTLQADAALKAADKVFYSVGDPATEAYILENNTNSTSLSVYYDVSKERYRTYVEMAEIMLREVRAGHNVLGIFYGHPSFFAVPSHRAVTIAREEGYEARMLAGVSSFDYMLADLEIEPAHHGCAIYDATDLLWRKQSINPTVHNVILQVAVVGVTNLTTQNTDFHRLIDYLVSLFGPSHRVILYAGAVLPQGSSAMVPYSLEDFRNQQIVNAISSRSSLYIPPLSNGPSESSLQRPSDGIIHPLFGGPLQWVGPRFIESVSSEEFERSIIAELDQHVIPENHKTLRASAAMKRFMIDLALDQNRLRLYKENPSEAVAGVEGLTESETTALLLDSEPPIGAVMMRSSNEEPTPDALRSLLGWLVDIIFPVTPFSAAF